MAATLTEAGELNNQSILDKLIRDNISLHQRGCRSARVNFVSGESSALDVEKMSRAFSMHTCDVVSKQGPALTALNMEAARLRRLGANVRVDTRHTFIVASAGCSVSLSDFVSRLDFVFLFYCDPRVAVNFVKLSNSIGSVNLLSCSGSKFGNILNGVKHPCEVRPLGSLNVARFFET